MNFRCRSCVGFWRSHAAGVMLGADANFTVTDIDTEFLEILKKSSLGLEAAMFDVLKICRVCGWDYGDYTWGEDGKNASFEICDCCGTEFGYEDATLEGILKKRNEWIKAGEKWLEPKERPEGWTYEPYLKNIPKKYFKES